MSVRLRLPDPDVSLRVLETLLQLYYEHRVQVRGGNTEVRKFFDAQVENYEQQLKDLGGVREQVRTRWNLSSVPDQRGLLLKRLHELASQIDANEAEKAMLRQQQQGMQARLKALPDELRSAQVVTPNPAMQSIKERITTLQLEHAKLSSRYDPQSQVMKNIDGELAALRSRLTQENPTLIGSITSEPNPLKQNFMQSIEQTEVKIAGLEASIKRLRSQTTAIEEQLKSLNAGEDQLEVIERERKIAEQNYFTYTKRREEARISEEFDRRRIANISILSPPVRPIEPVYPRKLFIMGLCLPVGLLFGIALALLLEYMNDAVSTPHDLAGLEGLAYLGTFRLQGLPPGVGLKTPRNGAKAAAKSFCL
jgi:uncharacterized protein involved in exopolysaccharide biosynthesis